MCQLWANAVDLERKVKMKNYKPMTGADARVVLNKLGYDILGTDAPFDAILGLIVSLAIQVEELQKILSEKGN